MHPARPGRPRGSRTRRRLRVVAVPPLCPACGRSLARLGSTVRVRLLPSGLSPTRQPSNRLAIRRTVCPCGQPIEVAEYQHS